MHNFFIPSYNRWNKCKTALIIAQMGVRPFVFVRPEQLSLYENTIGGIAELVVSEHKSIAGNRKNIVSFAAKRGMEYIWMVDDDVEKIYLNDGSYDGVSYNQICDKSIIDILIKVIENNEVEFSKLNDGAILSSVHGSFANLSENKRKRTSTFSI